MAKDDPQQQDSVIPGTMPRSQAVSTYGIGSVYELRSHHSGGPVLHSVMIAGLDWWPSSPTLIEPDLARSLGVRNFRKPPASGDTRENPPAIPSVRFPKWLSCSKCNRLGRVPREFDDKGMAGPKCKAAGCGGKGVPVRLVMACYRSSEDQGDDTQPGHVDDFPWAWWAHSLKGQTCSSPQLKLETEPNTTSLSGLVVRCYSEECKGEVDRSLDGVFDAYALNGIRCSGERPWLHDHEEGCNRKVRALLRGASNVYFPVTASAISIPPTSDRLRQLIADGADQIVMLVGSEPVATLVRQARNLVPELVDYNDEEIAPALEQLAGSDTSHKRTEPEQRSEERRAMRNGRVEDKEASEFVAEPILNEALTPSLQPFLDRIVKVHRLREVRALRGFQRVTPSMEEDTYATKVAPLSRKAPQWLPAIEVRGEGIFLELNPDAVSAWEESPAVKNRIGILHQNIRKASGEKPEALVPSPASVLIHTLSHLLMKQLALESGYSSASLRERLYVGTDSKNGEPELGVLIYTAGTGTDGTLGGLVRQGDPEWFERILRGALEGAKWCSSDPLCIESKGQGFDALNLAACHACALVAETSCERRNTLLDRGLVIGEPDKPETGFFADLIASM